MYLYFAIIIPMYQIAPWPGDPRYQVSTAGEVCGTRYGLTKPLKLCPRTDKGGCTYLFATISNGVAHHRVKKVHHLVLETFVGPRPAGADTRHLNGNSLDNQLENLCYGSRSQNMKDQVRHGVHVSARKTKCKNGHDLYVARIDPKSNQRCCQECNNIAAHAYRMRDLETARERDQAYRKRNREVVNARARKRYRATPEAQRERARAYHERNREVINARQRERYRRISGT
jgi:hypothetical protein